MKLWINESTFVELEDRKSLAKEIAPRSRSIDWTGIFGLLPDPDPVLRKLSQDISVYRQLLSDAHVWSCYQSRKSGTLSCEWEIREPAKGSGSSGRSGGSIRANRRAVQTVHEALDNIDVYQAMSDILEAVFFGMSPMEVLWGSGARGQGSEIGWLPKQVVGKAPEWFGFDSENRLRFKSIDNLIEGELLPGYKFLLARHHASYQNPYGERVLSRCFWPVVFKKGGFKFWAIFTEKYGMPWLVGKVPRATNETERAQLLANLVSMVQDAVAVINDDESVQITEASGKRASAEIYEALIGAANREISKAILGQTLSTELDKGGSYAATKGHLEVREDLVDQDKRMVTAQFNTLSRWITELNSAGATSPVFAFFEEEDIQKERAERDKILYEQGVNFTKPYYQRVYNLEESDFELGARAQGPGAGGQPADDGRQTTEGNLPEFAEGDELARAKKAQERLDRLADAARDKAAPLFGKYKATVSRFLDAAKSIEQAAGGIIALYDELDAGALTELLTENLLAADKLGVGSVTGSKEFAEAPVKYPSDFTGQAFWGPGLPFEEAIDYFRAKAFTLSGVTKADLLAEVKDELVQAMEAGTTIAEFREHFEAIFEKHGFDPLHPFRVETTFRTNMQGAYQAGRYRQMTSLAVLAARPYWRYVSVMDSATRPEHAAMHGMVFPADHSFWQTWYPPNGFNCRCTVVTVSGRELEREGWKVETKDPTGGLFEPIDPATGNKMPARPLMPDPGWAKNQAAEAWAPDLSKYEPRLRGALISEVGETLEQLSG